MSRNSNLDNYEIDLNELIAALWSHKFLIILVTGLSIFLAGYHTLTAEKKFTAAAIFQIEQANNSGEFNLSNEIGALASLAGLSEGITPSSTDILLERVTGREFIVDLKSKFSLEQDPYFNQYEYDPNYKDPLWKATIKRMVGWQKTELEKNAIIENNVIGNYRQNVLFELTKSGAVQVSVTHTNPKKASYYSNNFMEEIRQMVEEESKASQLLRLNYLSETLADALQDMEKAQENLKTMLSKIAQWLRKTFFRQPET